MGLGVSFRAVQVRACAMSFFLFMLLLWFLMWRHGGSCVGLDRVGRERDGSGECNARRHSRTGQRGVCLCVWGVLDIMHGRSRMTIDSRIPTMPVRSTSGFHGPGLTLLAPSAKRLGALGESHEWASCIPLRTACEVDFLAYG